MPTLTSDLRVLLLEIVRLQCPSLTGRVASVDDRELTREERKHILGALGRELVDSGLDEESEPNKRGLQIEALIDAINRPNLKK